MKKLALLADDDNNPGRWTTQILGINTHSLNTGGKNTIKKNDVA